MGYKNILEHKRAQRKAFSDRCSLEGFLEKRKKSGILLENNVSYIDKDIDLNKIKENNKIEDGNPKRR